MRPINDIHAGLFALSLEYANDIKAVSFLAVSVVMQYIGFHLSMSTIQDFIMWLITAASAAVGVYYAYVNIQGKKLENEERRRKLDEHKRRSLDEEWRSSLDDKDDEKP